MTYNLRDIIPEIKISYHPKITKKDRRKVRKSADVYKITKSLFEDEIEYRERFYLLLLNRPNEIIGYSLLSVGGITHTILDIRIVFQIALKTNACGIILIHNHPSGNVEPSKDDKELTKRVEKAGKLLNINLIDHLIFSKDTYYSFTDKGLIQLDYEKE